MKIRVRDRKLPDSARTIKFKPLRIKNRILKIFLAGSLLFNCILIYLQYKS